jgi:hypothetical protein
MQTTVTVAHTSPLISYIPGMLWSGGAQDPQAVCVKPLAIQGFISHNPRMDTGAKGITQSTLPKGTVDCTSRGTAKVRHGSEYIKRPSTQSILLRYIVRIRTPYSINSKLMQSRVFGGYRSRLGPYRVRLDGKTIDFDGYQAGDPENLNATLFKSTNLNRTTHSIEIINTSQDISRPVLDISKVIGHSQFSGFSSLLRT